MNEEFKRGKQERRVLFNNRVGNVSQNNHSVSGRGGEDISINVSAAQFMIESFSHQSQNQLQIDDTISRNQFEKNPSQISINELSSSQSKQTPSKMRKTGRFFLNLIGSRIMDDAPEEQNVDSDTHEYMSEQQLIYYSNEYREIKYVFSKRLKRINAYDGYQYSEGGEKKIKKFASRGQTKKSILQSSQKNWMEEAKKDNERKRNTRSKGKFQLHKKIKKWNYQVRGKKMMIAFESLNFFTLQNPIRQKILSLVEWKWFDRFIMVMIILNSLFLGIYDYTDETNTYWGNILVDKSEFFFTAIFTIECALKILAYGLILSNGCYLRDAWNWLDFIVVITSIIGIFPNMGNISGLRTFRIFRPLRSLSALPSMRILVSTLLSSLAQLGNVFMLTLFFFGVFAILGISLWNGMIHKRCRLTEFPVNGDWPLEYESTGKERVCGGKNKCKHFCGSMVDAYYYSNNITNKSIIYRDTKVEGLNWGYTNFDNILYALLTIFQSISLEGWADILYIVQDGYSDWFGAIYFSLCIIICSYFLLNLTVAVMLENFSKLSKRDHEVEELLEDYYFNHQVKKYIKLGKEPPKSRTELPPLDLERVRKQVKEAMASKIKKKNITFKEKIQDLFNSFIWSKLQDPPSEDKYYNRKIFRKLYQFVNIPLFNTFIYLIIIANTILLALDRYPAPSDKSIKVSRILNTIFTVFFAIEQIFKIIAFKFKIYYRDKFNIFDTIVMIVSLIELTIDRGKQGSFSALRAFRLFRLLKVARSWENLRIILDSVAQTITQIGNFTILLSLFIYIYSLLGMQFFAGKLKFNDKNEVDLKYGKSPRQNFDTLLWALVTVFEVLVGEKWNKVMYSAMRVAGPQASLYFVSLTLFGNIIMLNLFLAILLGNFEEASSVLRIKKFLEDEQEQDIDSWHQDIGMLEQAKTKIRFEDEQKQTQQQFFPDNEMHPIPEENYDPIAESNNFDNNIANNLQRAKNKTIIQIDRLATMKKHKKQNQEQLQANNQQQQQPVLKVEGNEIHERIDSDEIFASKQSKILKEQHENESQIFQHVSSFGESRNHKYEDSSYDSSWMIDSSIENDDEDIKKLGSRGNKRISKDGVENGQLKVQDSEIKEQNDENSSEEEESNRRLKKHTERDNKSKYKSLDIEIEETKLKDKKREQKKVLTGSRSIEQNIILPNQDKSFTNIQSLDTGQQNQLFQGQELKIMGLQSNNRSKFNKQTTKRRTSAEIKQQKKNSDFDIAIIRGVSQNANKIARIDETIDKDTNNKQNINKSNLSLNISDNSKSFEMLDKTIDNTNNLSIVDNNTNGDKHNFWLRFEAIKNYMKESSLFIFHKNSLIRRKLMTLVIPPEDYIASFQTLIARRTVSGVERKLTKQLNNINNKNVEKLSSNAKCKTLRYCIKDNLIIIASSFFLVLDNPVNDPESPLRVTLFYIDSVFTFIFAFEALIKIIAFGFINTSLKDQKPYLGVGWNILDILVVLTALLDFFVADSSSALKSLKALRALRALRPLRVISRNEGLKIVVESIFSSLPALANVMLVSGLFTFIYAIVGINFFKGKFYYCQINFSKNNEFNYWNQDQQHIKDQADCLKFGGKWVNNINNFDDILEAFLTLFQMMTGEGWLQVMYSGIDSKGVGLNPHMNSNPAYILYFVSYIITGHIFIFNLFVGIVIENFNRMKDTLCGFFLMTNEQRNWVELQKFMIRKQLMQAIIQKQFYRPKQMIPSSYCRHKSYEVVKSNKFEIIIFVCILLNTIAMMMRYYPMTDKYESALEYTQMAFAIIFNFECFLKIMALGKNYFNTSWNKFDFFIVLGTDLGLFFRVFQSKINVVTAASIVRAFRIMRIFRLIRTSKNLKVLIDTIIYIMPSIANLGALILLLLFIYSVLGMQLFGAVMFQDQININANFQSFGTAIMTLMRCATGERWNQLMIELANQKGYNGVECIKNQSYDQMQKDGILGCGSELSYVYFISFEIFIAMMIMNLFIAVVIEGFNISSKENKGIVTSNDFQMLIEKWADYDKNATGWISPENLAFLMYELPPPLGRSNELENGNDKIIQMNRNNGDIYDRILSRNNGINDLRNKFIVNNEKNLIIPQFQIMKLLNEMQLPVYSNKMVHFKDICIKLAKDAIKQLTGKDDFIKIGADQEKRLLKEWNRAHANIKKQDIISEDSGSYFAGQFIIRIQRNIRERRRKRFLMLDKVEGKNSKPHTKRKVSSNNQQTITLSPDKSLLTKSIVSRGGGNSNKHMNVIGTSSNLKNIESQKSNASRDSSGNIIGSNTSPPFRGKTAISNDTNQLPVPVPHNKISDERSSEKFSSISFNNEEQKLNDFERSTWWAGNNNKFMQWFKTSEKRAKKMNRFQDLTQKLEFFDESSALKLLKKEIHGKFINPQLLKNQKIEETKEEHEKSVSSNHESSFKEQNTNKNLFIEMRDNNYNNSVNLTQNNNNESFNSNFSLAGGQNKVALKFGGSGRDIFKIQQQTNKNTNESPKMMSFSSMASKQSSQSKRNTMKVESVRISKQLSAKKNISNNKDSFDSSVNNSNQKFLQVNNQEQLISNPIAFVRKNSKVPGAVNMQRPYLNRNSTNIEVTALDNDGGNIPQRRSAMNSVKPFEETKLADKNDRNDRNIPSNFLVSSFSSHQCSSSSSDEGKFNDLEQSSQNHQKTLGKKKYVSQDKY